MKKIMLILFGSFVLSDITFAQQKPQQKEDDTGYHVEKDQSQKIPFYKRKTTFYVGGGYNYREYGLWKLGINIYDITCATPFFQNVYMGFEITKKSQFGLEIGVRPKLGEWNKVRVFEQFGIVFHDRETLYAQHDSLVSETAGKQRRIIFALQLGLGVEFARRFGIVATFHPGVSLCPDSHFNWQNNGYYYYSGEIAAYLKFGGTRYKKQHYKMVED